MSAINKTLSDRQKTHGDFQQVAKVAETLMGSIEFQRLSASQSFAVRMIVGKLARIVCGNPDEPDHWHDIAGYATLVENEIKKVSLDDAGARKPMAGWHDGIQIKLRSFKDTLSVLFPNEKFRIFMESCAIAFSIEPDFDEEFPEKVTVVVREYAISEGLYLKRAVLAKPVWGDRPVLTFYFYEVQT